MTPTDYVEVEPALKLPRVLQAAETEVRLFDPALRLRQSASRELRGIGCGYILERKTRYTAPVHTATVTDSAGNVRRREDPDVKVASRDGYVIVSPVHISRLMRPASIVEELRDGDMAHQTAAQRFQRLMGAQAEAKAQRRAFRFGELRGFYRESFDILDRVGDSTSHAERTRIGNAGGVEKLNVTDRRRIKPEDVRPPTTPTASAGESPAKESSDVHTPGTTGRREDGQLHPQPAV